MTRDRLKLPSSVTTAQDATKYFERHERVRTYDMEVSRVHSVKWNCIGDRIACASQDRKFSVGTVDDSGRVRCSFVSSNAHSAAVDCVAAHATNPHIFASASTDKTIVLWDLRKDKSRNSRRSIETKGAARYVSFSPRDSLLACSEKDGRISIIDERMLKIVQTKEIKSIDDVIFDSSGKYLFVAASQGKVHILNSSDLSTASILQAHPLQSFCATLALSPDGRYLAVGASDALCSLWDLQNMVCERGLTRQDYCLRGLSFSCDSKILAIASEDNSVDIAFVEDGSRVWDLRLNQEAYSVAWHPRQYLLAVSTADCPRDRTMPLKVFGYTS